MQRGVFLFRLKKGLRFFPSTQNERFKLFA
jgi:hypothetical protein